MYVLKCNANELIASYLRLMSQVIYIILVNWGTSTITRITSTTTSTSTGDAQDAQECYIICVEDGQVINS